MVPNPVYLTRKTPLLYCFVGFPCKPTSHSSQRTQLSLNPVQITGFRACSSSTLFSNSLNYSHGAVFKDLDGTRKGYRQLGVDQSRLLAVSDGGSGGSGGSGGVGGSSGGGGEGSGASSGSGGNSNWSFLSW